MKFIFLLIILSSCASHSNKKLQCNRTSNGYRILSSEKASLLSLGLKQNDVITHINGKNADLKSVQNLYSNKSSLNNLSSISIKRARKNFDIHFKKKENL